MELEVLLLEKILIQGGFPIHHLVSVTNTLSFVLRVKQGWLDNILTTSVYIGAIIYFVHCLLDYNLTLLFCLLLIFLNFFILMI